MLLGEGNGFFFVGGLDCVVVGWFELCFEFFSQDVELVSFLDRDGWEAVAVGCYYHRVVGGYELGFDRDGVVAALFWWEERELF